MDLGCISVIETERSDMYFQTKLDRPQDSPNPRAGMSLYLNPIVDFLWIVDTRVL